MSIKRTKKRLPTGINLVQLRRYISKYYGGRCKTYLWGCPDCMAWRLYDEAKDFNEFADEINQLTNKKRKTTST